MTHPESAAPNARAIAVLSTVLTAGITVGWVAYPAAIPFLPWTMWIWFVCVGATLLAAARFRIRHCIPLPELWLLSFPFLFEVFFQFVIPTKQVPALDEFLWVFDRSFGYPQPHLSNLLLFSPAIFWSGKLIWWSLPTLFVVLYLLLPDSARPKYLAALCITGILILPMYALCPAAGPIYLFRSYYPGSIPRIDIPHRIFLSKGLLLNTTPSGHFAWALLLFWFAKTHCRRTVQAFFALVVICMAVTTLGLGEHYAIDLVLAVPYAAAIWALIEKRWQQGALLIAVVLVWLVALRQGWALRLSTPEVLTLSALTVLLPVALALLGVKRSGSASPLAAATTTRLLKFVYYAQRTVGSRQS